MKKAGRFFILLPVLCFYILCSDLCAQSKPASLSFTVSIKDPASHLYHVVFNCSGIKQETVEYKMPVWTPGYYQVMNYAANIQNFNVVNSRGSLLKWEKSSENGWKINTAGDLSLVISYDVKATTAFVAGNYLDEERGYISPAGLFIFPAGMINNPVTVQIEPYPKWSTVATGLEPVKGKANTFYAADYDVLFDSPILMGNLESFPSFTVNGITHYFKAFKPGVFNQQQFMDDLQKIITTASGIIGDIPYSHYTFLAIGPGGGGIEHLNSASIAFSGEGLNTKEGRNRIYNFLAHEYFHHYNVKRIRPVELGPFDYDKGSRTRMLWLSEGVTVYYEYLILKRAGLTSREEMLQAFQASIKNYETKPGRNFQTPADASYRTWDEGPFGRTGDEVNRTISPYDKGPLLGMLLDLKIRHETKNKRSLDDLMRLLYNKYYKQKSRGFTEAEFRSEAEQLAGASLADFFDYIYTLKPVDYSTYLGYAGLAIDTVARELPGAWLGVAVRDRGDSLLITNSEWQSPAWAGGLRRRNAILQVNGSKMNAQAFNGLMASLKAGDKIKILFTTGAGVKEEEFVLQTKKEGSYAIKQVDDPGALQTAILKSWFGEN